MSDDITDNVTDMREWEADRLIARDAQGFDDAMLRATRRRPACGEHVAIGHSAEFPYYWCSVDIEEGQVP